MSKRNPSLLQLRQQMADLQQQINRKEEELNMEIGAWLRHITNLDSLHDIQQNFRIVPIKNESEKTTINTHTTAPYGADNSTISYNEPV